MAAARRKPVEMPHPRCVAVSGAGRCQRAGRRAAARPRPCPAARCRCRTWATGRRTGSPSSALARGDRLAGRRQPGHGRLVAALGEAGAAGVPVVDEDGHQPGVGVHARSTRRRCPSGRRSRTAAAGRSTACSAACAAPGTSAAVEPGRARGLRRRRSTRPRGCAGGAAAGRAAPRRGPRRSRCRLRRNDTTWLVTSTVPKCRRRRAPRRASARSRRRRCR